MSVPSSGTEYVTYWASAGYFATAAATNSSISER